MAVQRIVTRRESKINKTPKTAGAKARRRGRHRSNDKESQGFVSDSKNLFTISQARTRQGDNASLLHAETRQKISRRSPNRRGKTQTRVAISPVC